MNIFFCSLSSLSLRWKFWHIGWAMEQAIASDVHSHSLYLIYSNLSRDGVRASPRLQRCSAFSSPYTFFDLAAIMSPKYPLPSVNCYARPRCRWANLKHFRSPAFLRTWAWDIYIDLTPVISSQAGRMVGVMHLRLLFVLRGFWHPKCRMIAFFHVIEGFSQHSVASEAETYYATRTIIDSLTKISGRIPGSPNDCYIALFYGGN